MKIPGKILVIGPVDLTLDGDDLTLAALPTTKGGANAENLVALTGAGSAELLDAATPAKLQVMHASPTAASTPLSLVTRFRVRRLSDLSRWMTSLRKTEQSPARQCASPAYPRLVRGFFLPAIRPPACC